MEAILDFPEERQWCHVDGFEASSIQTALHLNANAGIA
jgi:hypothetical protein